MMLAEKNDWYVRHARRILQERAAAGKLDAAGARTAWRNRQCASRCDAAAAGDVGAARHRRVAGRRRRDAAGQTPSEYVRAWAIQLVARSRRAESCRSLLPHFAAMAKDDPSPVVRLYLASALQRVPLDERWDILGAA